MTSAHGPGAFTLMLDARRRTRVLTRDHRAVGRSSTALPPDQACEHELTRRQRLLASSDESLQQPETFLLPLAADQFIVRPATRAVDDAQAYAVGAEPRTVIAGYPWFTDWGRDTMISLEGLTLVTGRHSEAHDILRTFALHVRHGLIPNLFPEGQREGLYHTADATLWFFHALHRYDTVTGDHALVEELLPVLQDIVRCHRQGTAFNIHVDADGLLTQGARRRPAHVDGRPRRRLGGDAAARQGRRDQRALAQRAGAARRLARSGRARRGARRSAGGGGPLPPRLQRAVLESGDAAPERRRRRRAGRRRRLPAEPDPGHRRAALAARSAVLAGRARERDARAGDAGRPADAVAARTPTTSASTSATCAPATPPITRARCGRG